MDAGEQPAPATEGNDHHPRSIRITPHGKIKNWVTFALDFFENQPDVPLVLHTLPVKGAGTTTLKEEDGKKENGNADAASRLPTSLSTAPRLVTVVEIIKREFLKRLAAKRVARVKGLHQYNEIGTLDANVNVNAIAAAGAVGEDGATETEQGLGDAAGQQRRRAQQIVEAISGKNHVRQTQVPYMRVTLSLCELPHLVANGATYQPPTVRTLSKSAKARARKREKNGQEAVKEDVGEPSGERTQ